MRFSMSSLTLASALLAAVAFTSKPAMAAATLHVPFDFVASGQICPAGDYMVRAASLGNTVSLQCPSGKLFWLIGPGSANPGDQRIVLTFDKDHQNYLLRTVQYGSRVTNRLDKPGRETIPAAEQIVGGE